MTERERWIVYPLLFFAIAMILREHMTDAASNVIRSDFVICEQLQVVDAQGRVAVHVGSSGRTPRPDRPTAAGSGFVDIYAPAGRAAGQAPLKAVSLWVDAAEGQGVIETFNSLGMSVVEIAGDQAGGRVRINDRIGLPLAPAPLPAAIDDPRSAPPRPPVPPTNDAS